MSYDVRFGISAGVTGSNKVDALGKSVRSLDSAGDMLARTFSQKVKPALIGFAGLMTTGAIIGFTRQTVNLGDALNDMRQKTGIAVETLADFKLAADMGGSSLESLGGALTKLQNNMIKAADGGKAQQRAFNALGVEVRDVEGKIRATDQVMLDIADRFAGMEDGAGKTAAAIAVFGKSGAEIIPFLNQGRDEIEKFSLALTGEFAQNADDFNDSLALTKNRLMELTASAITPLLPELTAMQESLAGGLESLTGSIEPVAEGLADLAHDIGLTVGALGSLIDTLGDSFAVVELFEGGLFLLDNVLKLVLISITAVAGAIAKVTNGVGAFVSVGGAGLEKLKAGLTGKKSTTNILGAGGIVEQWRARDEAIDAEFGGRMLGIAGGRPDGPMSTPRTGARTGGAFQGFGDEGYNKAMDAFILKQKQGIDALKDEISMIGKTRLEIEKLKAAREIDNAAQDAAKDVSASQRAAILAQAEAYKEQTLALLDLKYQQERTFGAGAKAAFNDYIESASNAAKQAEQLFGNAFKKMEDVVVDFVMTGKASFKDFARSIIEDIVRIHVQSTITTPIAGFFSNLAGSLFGATSGAGLDASAVASRAAIPKPNLRLADGGSFTVGQGFPSIQAGRDNRLVSFAARDGERVRVETPGSGGSGGGVHVEINFNGGSASQTSRGNDDGTAAQLAGLIKGVLQNEMRAGGLLSGYATG